MHAALAHTYEGARQPAPAEAPIETLYATGHWLMQQGRDAEAVVVLRVLLLRAPDDERPWLALGECHERAGQDHVALELYGLGTVAAKSCRCHLARARVHHRLGRDVEAAADLEQATVLGADDAELATLIAAVAETLQ